MVETSLTFEQTYLLVQTNLPPTYDTNTLYIFILKHDYVNKKH